MADEVLVRTEGAIQIVTINRPESRNAVNLAVSKGIEAAIADLDARDELRVGIITGAGGTFCAGMDLKAFTRGETPMLERSGFAGLVAAPPRKPLIAAVEGYALAGGFEIALACDLLVAAREARFGLPEVKRGLIAAAGGLMRLPRRIPYHIAMELGLTGRQMTAAEAHGLGLVNRLVESGQALEIALELAREIADNGPLAVVATKQVIAESGSWSEAEMFEQQEPIAAPIAASHDAREGALAFAEKRSPVWQGR